ncbi:hypothetical protein [Pseudomonas indica]|uniref:Uncharacterized protein n=1 Tax=Pseudomonas indica TaxID=137658 RepID=A0A1G8V5G1_9PSED|nr:hypothetical protein [Pseudomonas indica]SDJ60585.1 hypothetical protein SAMN05216186_10285 [Pseudomonas indica]
MSIPENMLEIINGRMHEGACPTSGSLGECCIISEAADGLFESVLYIWDSAFNDSAAVAGWFKGAGASDVSVKHTLYSDWNDDRDGKTIDGMREWSVVFTLAEQTEIGREGAV